MANAKAVIRLDNMSGTTDGTLLRSCKYFVDTTATDIENGNVVKLSGLMSGEAEIYKCVAPEATTAKEDIVLVAGVELMYDERKKNLDEFVNLKGVAFRGYQLHSSDVFSVTAEALAGTPAVDSLVELKADTKLNVVTAATSGSTQIGKIIAKETVGSKDFYVIVVG